MSKTRKKRRKMKPYQVKLRVIGVMSLIVSMLVLWLPVPSRAADTTEPQTEWQKEFDNSNVEPGTNTATDDNYIDLGKFVLPATSPDYTDDKKTSMKSATEVKIPVTAIAQHTGHNNLICIPRIGTAAVASDVFNGNSTLKMIDLTNVRFNESVSFEGLFKECTALEKVVFPTSANTSGVTRVKDMFLNDTGLKELDLSALNLAAVVNESDGEGMLSGCNNLIQIKTPKNISDSAKIKLPHAYQDEADLSKAYTELPTRTQAGADQSITLIPAVTKLEVDPSGKAIEVGDSFYLTISVDPVVEGNKTVSLSTNSAAVTVDNTTVEVGSNGKASVKVNGVVKGDARITASIQGVDETNNAKTLEATCDVTVTDILVPVNSVTIKSPGDATSVDINDTLQLSPEFTPTNPSDDSVQWSVSDSNLATITGGLLDPTGNGIGTVRVYLVTNDGGKQAYKDIDITTTKAFKEVIDNRKDTSNGTETKGNVSNPALTNDWYLHIDSLDTNNSSDKTVIDQINALLSAEGGFDKTSFFVLSKHNANPKVEGTTNLNDDFGTAVIRMALPGGMLAVPNHTFKQLLMYAYDGTSLTPINIARDSLGLNNGIGAVRFAVDTADSELATAYVLAMDPSTAVTPSGYLFKVTDNNAHAAQDAVSTNPTKAQTKDLYLVVNGITESASANLRPLVVADAALNAYPQKYYYDIYITDQPNLSKPSSTTPIDFGSVEITLPLPTGVTWNQGKLRLVSEHNGAMDKNEEPKIVENTTTGDIGVQFTATQFSEHAILYDPSAVSYTITTAHTGTGTTSVESGTGVTVTTTSNGNAIATVSGGNPVTVTATSGSGYHFDHWADSTLTTPITTQNYTFTPAENRTVTAIFVADTVTPTPTPVTTYTVTVERSPSGGGEASADKATPYTAGETATLTATPAAGWSFARWEEFGTHNELSRDNPYTITVDNDKHVTAVFVDQRDVAGAERTIDVNANVQVSVPPVEATVTVPDINANINVSIPDVNVYLNGAGGLTAVAGTSGSFIPVRIGNSIDMPRTGIGDIYRMLFAMLLVLSGTVEIMLSIPAKKRKAVHHRIS